MKISLSWLNDFVDIEKSGLSPEDLAQTLTKVGLAVEGIEVKGEEVVLDVDVTSNRSDCLSHLGIAREFSAALGLELRKPEFVPPPSEFEADRFPTSVSIEDPEGCPRYAARLITGIRIGASPDWLRRRLELVGQRSINNVVDVTNYVLLAVGHPLHAFDYRRLEENRIVVRRARSGEALVTLDGERRELDPSMLLICDAQRPVALAGIMGGGESEVSGETQTILLESAFFQPSVVRSTAKELGMRTEASYRFERGADPEMPPLALHLACRLILEVAGGACAGPTIDQYPNPQRPAAIHLRLDRIRRVTGSNIGGDTVREVLPRLEFQIEETSGGDFKVEIPSFRSDVGLEDDVVEEVARHYGYDRIESRYPAPVSAGRHLSSDEPERRLLEALTGCGFWEAYNYVFSTPAEEEPFQKGPMIPISNPLTAEDSHLRTTLLPGLLESVRHNLNHSLENVRLFEIGHVFLPGPDVPHEDFREVNRLGLVAMGGFYQPYWNAQARDSLTFLHFKGVLELLFERLQLSVEYRPVQEVPYLHSGRAAQIRMEGEVIGVLGQLHPRLQQRYKFTEDLFVAELELEPVYGLALPEPSYTPLSRYPAVVRDWSFVVDKGVQYATIRAAIKALNIWKLQDIQVIDLYQGPSLPADKLSLTVRLTFSDPERTLTQEEINELSERVFSVLRSEIGAEPRS